MRFDIFYNRIYYCTYVISLFLHNYVIGKIYEWFLFRPLYKFRFVRRRYQKLYGWNSLDEFIKGLNCPHADFNSVFLNNHSNMLMGYIEIVTLLFLINIVMMTPRVGTWLRNIVFNHVFLFLMILGSFVLIIDYNFLWSNNKHKKYFEVFDKESSLKRKVWSLGVFLYCVIIFIGSLWTFGKLLS